MVHHAVELVGGRVLGARQVEYHARIQITGSRPHHEAVEPQRLAPFPLPVPRSAVRRNAHGARGCAPAVWRPAK